MQPIGRVLFWFIRRIHLRGYIKANDVRKLITSDAEDKRYLEAL